MGEEWVTGGSWPCAGRRSCLAELHSDRGDDPEFGQNVYWQMCFKGVLLSWSWQRKIPCCSAHLQHSTRPRFYLQESWPFKKKWWRSWPCLGFLFFSLSFSHSLLPFLFFHTIEPLSMLGLKANSSPLCTLFHITFKSSAGLARAPRLLASVQRFASEVTICDAQMTWAGSCWWLFRRFCKLKPVMCYVMWLETSTSKLLFSQHTI